MSNVVYTGQNRSKIAAYVENAGGKVGFEVVNIRGEVVASGAFTNEAGLSLYCEGSPVSSVTDLFILLHECGYSFADSDGANTEGGNAANCVVGNFGMYPSIHLETGITLADVVNPSSQRKMVVRETSSKSAPSERKPKISKADQRIMRPANGKAVWNDAYIKAKGIDYTAFLAKHGKEQVYADLGSMTVIEFETKYDLR